MARWLACLSVVSCVGPDEVQIDQKRNSKVDNYIQLIVHKSLHHLDYHAFLPQSSLKSQLSESLILV